MATKLVNASTASLAVLMAMIISIPPASTDNAVRVGRLGILRDVHGYRVDGKVLVPLRGVAEALGANVEYNSPRIVVTLDQRRVSLTLGSSTASVNGHAVTLSVPPNLYGGITCVPLRFVGESLGADVSYHSTYDDPLAAKVAGLPFAQVESPSRSYKVIVHGVSPAWVASIVATEEAKQRAAGLRSQYGRDWVFECIKQLSSDYVWSSDPYGWEPSEAGGRGGFLHEGGEGSVWRRRGQTWEHAGYVGLDTEWKQDLVAQGVPAPVVRNIKWP